MVQPASMVCRVECVHGVCVNGSCVCDPGWDQVIDWDVGNPGDARVAPCLSKAGVIRGSWWAVLVLAALNTIHRIYYVVAPGGGKKLKEYTRAILEPINDLLALLLACDHLLNGHVTGFGLYQSALTLLYINTFMAMVDIQNQKNIILLNKGSALGLKVERITKFVKLINYFMLRYPFVESLCILVSMYFADSGDKIFIFRLAFLLGWAPLLLRNISTAFAFHQMLQILKVYRDLSQETGMDTAPVETAIKNWEVFLNSIKITLPVNAAVGIFIFVVEWFRFFTYVIPAIITLMAILKLVVAHSLMESSLRRDRKSLLKVQCLPSPGKIRDDSYNNESLKASTVAPDVAGSG